MSCICTVGNLDIDGPRNSVYEVEAEPVPAGPDNPGGNAFRARHTLLSREHEARRDADPAHGRCWLVVNESVRGASGRPAGYLLALDLPPADTCGAPGSGPVP